MIQRSSFPSGSVVSLFLAVVLFMVSSGLYAQDAEQTGPHTLMVFIDISSEPVDPVMTEILDTRLREELEVLEYDVSSDSLYIHRPLPGENSLEGSASESIETLRPRDFYADIPDEGIDIIVATFIRYEGDALLLQFALVDPASDTGVGGLFTRGRAGLTLFTTINDAVTELSPVLAGYIRNRYVYVEPKGRVEEIRIHGEQEQVAVFLVTRLVGEISQGGLLVPYSPFQVGSVVRLDIEKPGYHSWSGTVVLNTKEVDIDIPELEEEHRIALQTYLTLGMTQGVGVALNYYINPDYTYVHIGNYFHNAVYGSGTASSNVNYDVSFAYGQYLLFPPGSFIRTAVHFGGGVIRSSVGTASIQDFTDYYINMISPSLEFDFGGFQLFVRPELKYTLGIGDNLLGRAWLGTLYGIPNLSIGAQVKW